MIDALLIAMQDFMVGKLHAIPGEVPTLADWENHLTTIFPEVIMQTLIKVKAFKFT